MGRKIATFDLKVPDGNTTSHVFSSIMAGVNQIGGQTVTRPAPNTLIISTRAPGLLTWGFMHRTQSLTVTVEDRDGTLYVSALGEGSPPIVRALERFLATM